MAKSAVEDLSSAPADSKEPKTSSKGPPPASPKPRSASDSSLYSTIGKAGMTGGMSGLGAEGNSPSLVGMQGLAMVQRGIQMLNLAFPENPGLVAILADLTGRLQTLIPQLVGQASNMGQGGMGMDQGMMGQQMGQPGMPGMGQPGSPGMGMGMPQPPPGAGAPMPQPAGPQGPPRPPM